MISVLCCVVTALCGVSCGDTIDRDAPRPEEIEYVKPTYQTYTNHIEIDGQWAASDRPDDPPFRVAEEGRARGGRALQLVAQGTALRPLHA